MPTSAQSAPSRPARHPRTRAAVVLGLVALLGACSGGTDAPTDPPVTLPPVITPAKHAAPAPVVPPRWVLTGVPATELVERPALAVKIENPKEVRPQTGLDQADVVWEQVVEGGVTRFVAVYHSAVPGEVGPIRSVRPMDPAIAAPLHGVIAFSGGQPGFVQALSAAGLQTVSHDAGDDGFYRTKGRTAPHNVFGDPAAFLGQADSEHVASPPEQFHFARRPELATAAVAGTPAAQVAVTMSTYSKPSWDWNPADGTWLRSESGTPATSASGARLAATNVVTLRVDLVASGTVDPAGSPVPETRLVGSGEALVATGGRTLAATWTKASTDAPLTLATADGTDVRLAPGATWVELVPNGTGAVTVG
ncbi:DUF3048 domain-containing protein [Cellulomonas sp. 179-A 4D5 NHS]|uniref:DUF3048 domain-containing protein n=1 Tax=Cellulomonas sp. 179-A 4D5 NHS TaxID=3142378 RepID=UPI0039A3BA27